ncbi:MAG TPA: thiamine pyrophosphate-dependent enzyme, partial [Tepidisphaeraceae bacterium]
QEVKDWINFSFKLSQAAGLYIGYIVTTAQADGGGSVDCHANQFPQINAKERIALETQRIDLNRVLLPPRTWQEELKIPQRFERTMQVAREVGINRIISGKARGQAVGFIVTGNAGPYLQHVLADIGLLGEFPILQMGMSYPVDVQLVREFAKSCKNMIVIEERRSFLEKNIRDAMFHALPHEEAADLASRLFGKVFPNGGAGIPDARGLNPSLLAQLLIPLIKNTEEIPAELRNGRLSAELEIIRKVSKPKLAVISEKIVARTPTFCPGCPHRDSSAALLELRENFKDAGYMQRVHNSAPVDLVAHGDTGCYTMLMFAPTEQLMHNYSGMGLGGGTGSGIDPFITNKQIVFMGDGTFFHSGQIAISNSIKANQDITYIILENKTTAMTGHQEHAGTELDVLGNRSYIQDIEQIVRAMAGTSPLTVEKLSPADREKYKKTLEQTILRKGVKVVIADKECGITYHRRLAKEERKLARDHGGFVPLKEHMNITPEVCEGCLECTKATACPGLTAIDTDYGRKIDTDLTLCVNDGACERVRSSNDYGTSVKPCPSFEQVKIIRNRRKRYSLPKMDLDKLPEPTIVRE